MKLNARLLAAAALGALAALALQAAGQGSQPRCLNPADLAHIDQRFDAIEQAVASLSTRTAQAAQAASSANADHQRQLVSLHGQLADLNTQVVELSGTLATLH